MNKLYIFVVTLFSVSYTSALKILVVYPLPLKSVNLLGEAQVKLLLGAGHEVTFVTPFPIKNTTGHSLRQIDVGETKAMMESEETENYIRLDNVLEHGLESQKNIFFQTFAYKIAETVFQNVELLNLLKNPDEEFDVVLADLFETELYSGLSTLYNSCPMIWSYSMGAHWHVLRLLDDPPNPAYTVHYLSDNHPPMSFFQRTQELWAQITWTFYKSLYTMPMERVLYKEIFKPLNQQRGKKLPPYDELIYNASMIFGNDYTLNGDVPKTPQNFKMLGGFHIDATMEPLPKELQRLMDNSEHGVIYFSMGSTWKSQYLPAHITQGLLGVFGQLKQTVIWKYEAELPDRPKNVHIIKWAPQRSILAHPSCVLFISHGGQLSSSEAVHFGVPILGIPIAFNQVVNIIRAEKTGYALLVSLNQDLVENLKLGIKEMIYKYKYRQRASEVSAIFHDRPVPPGSELVYWVEHVVRTCGAPHLRSPALMMAWYQKYYLDLTALIFVVIFVIIVSIKRFFSFIIIVCKERPKKKERKQKRN